MLKPSLLRMIVRWMRQHRLQGPLLTLGVQDVLLSYDQARQLLSEEGITPGDVPLHQRLATTSYLAPQHGAEHTWTHARTFFQLCGVAEYDDLDASTAEGPTLVHDLNQPVPQLWHGRFNWVLDSGTTEHVFEVRATLTNIVRLIALGGHVLHASPMTGWANHGFYQLSPCLFFDFYRANGFEPMASLIAAPLEGPARGLQFAPYEYTPARITMPTAEPVLFLFLARKVAEVQEIRLPIQTKYAPRMSAPIERLAG
jgi:hypothetical protein